MTNPSKQIDIMYFDAASGHRSAAFALQKVLQVQRPDWQIRCINVVDIFDHHPCFGWIVRTGIDRFNRQLQRDRVFDLKGQINLSLLFHNLLSEPDLNLISQFWQPSAPDAVVSVTPMYNPALYRAARMVNPQVECVTIPVDFEEAKPRYWFTPKVAQHYFNGTDRLIAQAKSAGVADCFNHQISGMMIDPQCYSIPEIDRPQELHQLGLNPDLPTGIVSFGGQGCLHSLDIAKQIANAQLPVNMIYLCGRNQTVFNQLDQLPTPYPKAVFGYLKETPIHYLHLADFAIGKPGSMTITEALITDTPLIIFKSRGMSPVQQGNECWVLENQVGIMIKDSHQVVKAITDLLSTPHYAENAQKQYHHAVFEVADRLCELIDQSTQLSSTLEQPCKQNPVSQL
jgi:hypothetical protein